MDAMSPTTVGILGLAALFVLIFSRMPVGFVMALVGLAGFGYLVSFGAAVNMMAKDLFDVFGSYNLTVMPLFILMGQIAFHAGISSPGPAPDFRPSAAPPTPPPPPWRP